MVPEDHPVFPKKATVTQLQKYIQEVIRYRGFDPESVSDNFILLCEEVGELAKAIRVYNGVKVATDSNIVNLEHEIADVFWMLACISNQVGVNITTAVRNKEEVNKRRLWIDGQGF